MADFSLEHLFENVLCDKLQIIYISKINKKSANLAVLSAFGIKVIINTCKFLQRLLTTNSVILKGAYKESSLIATNEKMSWVACVEFILKHIGVFSKLAYQQHFSSIVKLTL